ncbi:MAG: hypothetical protein KDA89_22770, partial [Planctomycetaceae bacterium]|nr:hypothetical protein [Planctomycetaceae bacterium]
MLHRIFWAVSDRNWILDGAAVHVSMVGFDDGSETERSVDGIPVPTVNANLSGSVDITKARKLTEHSEVCFMADTKGGAFDVSDETAIEWLSEPNPHLTPNSDVLFPWVNGRDVSQRSRNMWIIDFGVEMPVEDAAKYGVPFHHVDANVRPLREKNKRQSYREKWWIHVEPRPKIRDRLAKLPRFLTTISVGKHRLFVWMQAPTLPDHQVYAFVRSDDFAF